MYNSRKQPQPSGGPIRLPSLERLPNESDLSVMLNEAQRARGKQVKLAWVLDQHENVFLLTVTWEEMSGEPNWIMQAGEGSQAKIYWTYTSGDIGLILNFALAECTGSVQVQEVQMNSFFAGNKLGIAPNLSNDDQIASGQRPVDFQTVSERAQSEATMEGDLNDFSLPSLLQSVGMAAMSGLLSLRGCDGAAELFFEEGMLVHAHALGLIGDDAVMELFTWDSGKFSFFKDERRSERSVTGRIEQLVMQGVTLMDQMKYLRAAGARPDAHLINRAGALSEAEFEARVLRFAPVDMAQQKRFFAEVDDRKTLFDVQLAAQLTKRVWVPILFNLVSGNLVAFSDKPAIARRASKSIDASSFDTSMIDSVRLRLSREETGIYTYPALLFMLEHELDRFEETAQPLSLIVISARIQSGTGEEQPLPTSLLSTAVAQILAVKRKMDIAAHFETLDLALLLPNADSAFALMIGQRVCQLLLKQDVASDDQSASLAVRIGIASVPEHAGSMAELVGLARDARSNATISSPILMAVNRDVSRLS